MRISVLSLIGAGCTAALLLQVAGPGSGLSVADQADPVHGTDPGIPASGAARTTSLALETPARGPRAVGAEQDLTARATAGYSLLGVSWDDPAVALDGAVQVRTRSAGPGGWSGWRSLQAEDEDRPDTGSAESTGPHARGATAPLWVGPSDGVEVRATGRGALPAGLRVELVDPGADGPARGGALAPRLLPRTDQGAPRPGIVTRAGWGADESLRASGFVYTDAVKVVFVHHTDTSNDYDCSDSPKLIRSIYQYHVQSNGWRDIGYNFLVDKCGTIYEGRAGGVDQPVLGAHTLGFNTDSSGVAALGTFDSDAPPQAQLDGIAKITAWKLGLTGRDAGGSADLVSASDGSRYPTGTTHTFDAVSGHRDAFNTDCPGDALFGHLGDLRAEAAHLQGRS
ncbi:hypothetical protein P3T36_004381 [Kitasatospora sp. MAP12-15]|uniref:peptidoglycan recognition protein family protein n=1 Tax=unclassified Kitasatospora TaxID=2633591 RepID=UPI002473B883|nr:peptidoglycan recognition protein [Kitasatospora sp. MAP12-44]MDH6110807.1 hypothetical protein [Kitasatospora sp. MAP12-44]